MTVNNEMDIIQDSNFYEKEAILISRLVDRLAWKPINEVKPNTRCILTFNFVDAYTGQLEDDGLWYDGSYGIPTPTHWLPLPPVGE